MTDEEFMLVAIGEAKKGWGNTGRNPLVGAVIVEAGMIVSRGWRDFGNYWIRESILASAAMITYVPMITNNASRPGSA